MGDEDKDVAAVLERWVMCQIAHQARGDDEAVMHDVARDRAGSGQQEQEQ
jgi:hypothetical protein